MLPQGSEVEESKSYMKNEIKLIDLYSKDDLSPTIAD
jgi:hypothetical protein